MSDYEFVIDTDSIFPQFEVVVQHVSAEGGGGGQTIEVDSELSTTSNNPVKNKVITIELNKKVTASQLATVATTGSYNDLTNKPTIPTPVQVDVELDDESTNPVQNAVVTTALNGKLTTPYGGTSGQVLQKTTEGARWADIGTPSAEQIQTAVNAYIAAHPEVLNPISQATKSALLDIAAHVAYIDANGQSRYDALDASLNAKALLSITAVYTQSGTVYDTDSLDSLKDDLVVTAYYDDGTSEDVTATAELSGTLSIGTSIITVTYQEMTTTFSVTVSEVPKDYEVGELLYEWDFTQSLIDTVSGSEITLGGNATQDANGLTIPDASSYARMASGVMAFTRIVEIDVASTDAKFGNVLGKFLIMNGTDKAIAYRYNVTWNIFTGNGWSDNSAFSGNLASKNAFSGSLFAVDLSNPPKLYKDGALMGTATTYWKAADFGAGSIGATNGSSFYQAVITGMRVYAQPTS